MSPFMVWGDLAESHSRVSLGIAWQHLPPFFLSCCIKLLCKKGCGASVPGSSLYPCPHTPAGRGEIHRGEEWEGGAKRAREPGGSVEKLPTLLHPPGIQHPRLALPTQQLPCLGLGSSNGNHPCGRGAVPSGSLCRAVNGLGVRQRLCLQGCDVEFLEWESWDEPQHNGSSPMELPHGWDQTLLGMSQLPTLQPCPGSRRMILALHPLEYPILLGRAPGEEERPQFQELWAPAGKEGQGMLPHRHGNRSCHWVSLGIKLQHMGTGWCQRGMWSGGR